MNKPYVRLDRDNAAVLLVDHQAGLLSLVRDIDPDSSRTMSWPWPIWPGISSCRPS